MTGQDIYNNMLSLAQTVKLDCNIINTDGNTIPSTHILNLLSSSIALINYITQVVNTPDLLAALNIYVSTVVFFNFRDVFTQAVTYMEQLVQAIITDYPKDVSGNLLDRHLDNSGNIVINTFNLSQFPNTVAAIANLATIVH